MNVCTRRAKFALIDIPVKSLYKILGSVVIDKATYVLSNDLLKISTLLTFYFYEESNKKETFYS
jgi:hypothetical protein